MKNLNDNDRSITMWGILVGGIVVALWITNFLILKSVDERGQWGDMFGSVNALFSGLAFAGIIFTILLQKKELKLQREELQKTRQEFSIQNRTLRNQRFENTFFSLLTLHNEIIENITGKRRRLHGHTEHYHGREALEKMASVLTNMVKSGEQFEKSYVFFYNIYKAHLGHYFRNLYRIIRMIHETEFLTKEEIREMISDKDKYVTELKVEKEYGRLNYEEKYKYTSMVRAQLTDDELILLFFNCISSYGQEKFKPLVENYSLLKNITVDKKIESFYKLYDDKAYQN